jgi:exopolysaccharide production protein ExoQ
MLGFGVIALCMLVRRGPLHALIAGAGVLVAIVVGIGVVTLAPDLIVAALGRDLTLTGRTDIWEASARFVEASPWLGYGYYAFWLPDNGPAFWVREAVQWQVASAHSSWLEVGARHGTHRGRALCAAAHNHALTRRVRRDAPVAGLWAPAFLAAFALYTLSESHALQANNLFWIIYVAVAARLALDASARKHA